MNGTDLKTAFFVAYKTITRGNKSTAVFTVFILSLSFFNLMFVSGFLNGFSDGIMRSMIDNSTAHIIVMPQEEPTVKEFILNQEKVRAQIGTIPGVIGTARHYQLGGSFAYDKEKMGEFKRVSAPVVGVTQSEEKKILTVYKNIVSGEFPDDLKNDEIVLGANLSGGFGTKQTSDLGGAIVGDEVQVTYSNGITRTYTIRGIFKISMGGSVGGTAFISAEEAESILSVYDNASEIMVRMDLGRGTLDEYAEEMGAIAPNLKIEKYTNRLSTVGILVDAFDIIAVIVTVISIIVAAIIFFVMIFGSASLVYTPIEIFINIISLTISGIFAGFIPAKMVARQNILRSIWG